MRPANTVIYAQFAAILGVLHLCLVATVPESKTARTGISRPHPSLNINANVERDV